MYLIIFGRSLHPYPAQIWPKLVQVNSKIEIIEATNPIQSAMVPGPVGYGAGFSEIKL